jgi:isopentenyldiphosphate isomerase
MVFDRDGRLFLQKRAAQQGRPCRASGTASVGGHLLAGEHPGARRPPGDVQEELGADRPRGSIYAYYYLWRAPNESELVRTFVTLHEGPFVLPPEEIEEGRFWSFDEIEARLGRGDFTHQFEHEFPRLRQYWLRKQASMTHFTRE